MLVSESWLKEWVADLPESAELAERLTLSGMEVDSINTAGPILNNQRVLVGEILEVEPHPNADRLRLCTVSTGGKRTLKIVCGAPNARAGMKTAVATNRARLPQMQVLNREIRGVKSQGMLCSAEELGLSDSAAGIIEFDADAPVGRGVSDYLDLEDRVLELELTPNRGDCLGVLGVAREIATLTREKLRSPEFEKVRPAHKLKLPVELKAPEACPRFVGRAITGIDMHARTPDWMVEKLRRSGHRSINPIVDITNYVMHELGQPMHAFDMDTLEGGIRVRFAKPGETLYLLDDSTVTLSRKNLVIADHKKAIALAGIMGGGHTAISDKTTNIFLEAAFFSQLHIQGRARELGMHTDASHRFERGVNSEMQPVAMEFATRLVMEIAGGEPGPVIHVNDRKHLPKRPWISLDNDEIPRVLGSKINMSTSSRIMKDLGMEVKKRTGGWRVKPPSWRFDLSEQHDLVEEIGRCHGFENIPPRMPVAVQQPGRHLEQRLDPYSIKALLSARGYHEAVTYSFVEAGLQRRLLDRDDAVCLANPIADNMGVMRLSLWPGLLDTLRINLNRQETRVRLFEIGHVFEPARNARKSRETNRLGGLVCGSRFPRQWGDNVAEVDFFDLKADLESVLSMTGSLDYFRFVKAAHPALHPGQCAEIYSGKSCIGYIGKLNPAIQRYLDLEIAVYMFEIDVDFLAKRALPSFREVSKYPSVQRDLAVVVAEDIEVTRVLDLIRNSAGDLLVELELFDIYRGENLGKNKKSLAFSLTFQSESSNLTALEVDALTGKIIRNLGSELDAQLRN